MKRFITILLFTISMSFSQKSYAEGGVKIVIPQEMLENIMNYIQIETPDNIISENQLLEEIITENTEQNKIIAGFKYVNSGLNKANEFLIDSKNNVYNFISSKKYLLGIAGTSYGYIYTKYINPKFFEKLVSKTLSKSIDIISSTFKTIFRGIRDAAGDKPGSFITITAITIASFVVVHGTKLGFIGLTEYIKEKAKIKGQYKKKNNNPSNENINENEH